MLILPGVIQQNHSAVIDYAANMCLDRGDTFFVFDAAGLTANIATVTGEVETFDNNYAATYYPWVKILDAGINKPVWVPPSVVIPGVLAFNDRVAAEWYAPAGLNRGGLTSVIDAYTRLTHAERDALYEGRVNPIATFPGQGVCVWGQKTLQAKPSALDRINVRRLLIAVKKFIASATKYLVFENNTAATRNRFLNICNPYLESVQQRQGLYGFRVVMDESNNTPDVIDRNIMYGQIFLQPAKTAEFIIIDFNILPTGAAFPGA
jgi:phage tail sheath protein FI